MQKKAQIQMGESIAIVIVVIMLIFFGVLIYQKFASISAQNTRDVFSELDTIELATVFTSLPEIHCTFQQSADVHCIDAIKLEKFSSLLDEYPEQQLYYAGYFGQARISVVVVYPETETDYFDVYDSAPREIPANIMPVFVPVTVYYPKEDTFAFAYLNISRIS